MSNSRLHKEFRRRRQLEVREEAIDLGIAPGSPAYLVFLALIRERGMTFDQAKAQMDEWDAEREVEDDFDSAQHPNGGGR